MGLPRVIGVLLPAVFLVLGGVALTQWHRRHSEAAAWLARTILILTALIAVGRLVQPGDAGTAVEVGRRVLIVLLGAFPYSLYRFATSLSGPRRLRDRGALAGTLAIASAALLLPSLGLPDGAWPWWLWAFAGAVALQWTTLSVLSVHALWNSGRQLPGVARRRLRMLAAAVAVLNIALLMMVGSGGRHGPSAPPWQQGTALASGALFLVGFSPPGALRRAWRRRELEAFRQGEADLMSADSEEQVTGIMLPHAIALVGARAAVLVDGHGEVRDRRGVDGPGSRAVAERLPAPGTASGPCLLGDLVAVPVGSGWLAVTTTPATPLLGGEEIGLLGTLAHLAGLALERVELLDRERVSRRALAEREFQLAEAQHTAQLGSYTWDPSSGRVSWSDEMYRVLGFEPGEPLDHGAAFASRIHPEDRERVLEEWDRARRATEPGSIEYRIVLPGGAVRWVHARVQPVTAGAGAGLVGTVQDVTPRKQAEADLREALERERRMVIDLRDLARAKTDFVSTISHELRTPLTSIAGYVELLVDGAGGELSRSQLDVLEVVARNTRRLTSLIEDLLTLSRIDAGGFSLSLAPVAVMALVEGVRSAVFPSAQAGGVSLRFRVDPDVGMVEADAAQLDRVLLNLLSNAIKFTPAGGRVTVHVRRHADRTEFEVADTGIGIPPEEQGQLFNRFFRSSTATTQAIQGTGLGLAIVKTIVDQHGGRIGVDSVPGRGTTVTFSLPDPSTSDDPVALRQPVTL
jgi:PAS domain S-box-containing protein